jgi:hypothetical protein
LTQWQLDLGVARQCSGPQVATTGNIQAKINFFQHGCARAYKAAASTHLRIPSDFATSGHYVPAAAHFLSNTKVTFKTPTTQTDYGSVQAFKAALKLSGLEADFDYAKMMAYLNAITYRPRAGSRPERCRRKHSRERAVD